VNTLQNTMARISREAYVQHMASSLNLPPAVIEQIIGPRPAGDDRDGGWKVIRMLTVADLQPYGLEGRLTASGWRTILRSIVED
jgi:hypothetical protein